MPAIVPPTTDDDDGDVEFRLAVDDDAPTIAALVHNAYRGDESAKGWTSEAHLLEGQRISTADVLRLLAEPDALVLLGLDDDGSILACCELRRSSAELGYFGMFAVRPGRTGAGTGRIVLAEAERFAVERWGVTAMELTVIGQRSELIAWYERRGYVLTGATKPFPYEDRRFGDPRRDDLHFVVLQKPLTDQVSSDSSR